MFFHPILLSVVLLCLFRSADFIASRCLLQVRHAVKSYFHCICCYDRV